MSTIKSVEVVFFVFFSPNFSPTVEKERPLIDDKMKKDLGKKKQGQ